jgi:hypothetical protein
MQQPRGAAHDQHIARAQPEALRAPAALGIADPEQAIVAKADGDDGLREIGLVAVLMQAHAGLGAIIVHEAAFGRARRGRQRAPDAQDALGDRGPGRARGVGFGIAVAAPIGDPAEAPGRCHPHAHRPAMGRHRRKQRRGLHQRA